MRRRVGIEKGDILDAIASWPTDRAAAATAAIAEMEEQALERMRIMPGALELCAMLDAAGIPRALVTRNVSSSVDFFHKTHFSLPPFFPAISREWTPYKPDPAAIHHIAEHWGVDSSELMMIGDSAKDDVVAGNRAGAVSVLIDVEGRYPGRAGDARLGGELRPDYYVDSLQQVADLLGGELDLRPPPARRDAATGEPSA
jgi:HAD superfamily hydrolase (TIGR01549 family)